MCNRTVLSGHIPNNKAIKEANRYHGYFVLISNKEKDPFECLRKYRKRETIESFFRADKQNADSTRSRVWYADTLRGRMFVQFITLCYYEYFAEKVRQMKASLGVKNGNPEHDSSKNMKIEKELKSWLVNTPLYLQLQWFDTLKSVDVSAVLKRKRWGTEITRRDQMYLDQLGVMVS